MTATIAAADLDVAVRRADDRWARRHGDEPAAPEYLKQITDAVRPLLTQPVAAPSDDSRVKQLLFDKQRLQDLVDELRKHVAARDKALDRQAREIAALKQDLATAEEDTRRRVTAAAATLEAPLKAARDEVDKLRQALTLRTTELDVARAERDTARSRVRDLTVLPQSGGPAGSLTPRELQVLLLVSHGMSNATIGNHLSLSEDTIKTHCRRIFRKLGARDRTHAVAIGYQRGLLGGA